MNFCSDNVTPAAEAVIDAVIEANMGPSMPYGNDPTTARAAAAILEAFALAPDAGEVHLLGTGTAANGLALAQVTPPYGAVICHAASHVNTSECGGPELHTGGAKLLGLPGRLGKLLPEEVMAVIDRHADRDPHHSPPRALSLTNATETGQVYTPDEVRALAEVAHAGGLAVHMDGARFANAVAALGCDPADLTWRAGVDIMSFGGTKNGCIAAEAVVIFNRDIARDFSFRIKRAGHVWSKSRFIAAQYLGYLKDGNWLRYAGHANAMAARLAQGLTALPGCRLLYPVEANLLFAVLPAPVRTRLREAGYAFYDMPTLADDAVRLVTAHDTRPEDVDGFLATARAAVRPDAA
jgi:threonine aldolase